MSLFGLSFRGKLSVIPRTSVRTRYSSGVFRGRAIGKARKVRAVKVSGLVVIRIEQPVSRDANKKDEKRSNEAA